MTDEKDPPKRRRPRNPMYRKYSQVTELLGFDPDRAFKKEEYTNTIGDYDGEGLEFTCRLIKKNGYPCRTPHDWGYIVELSDGTLTMIGNECIYKEIDKEDSMYIDVNRYRRKREHLARLEAVTNELEYADGRIKDMESFLARIKEIEDHLNNFRSVFGNKLCDTLINRAKSSKPEIVVTGIIERIEYNEMGDPKFERRPIKYTLDNIKGLDLFSDNRLNALRTRINRTLNFYKSFSLDDIPEGATDTEITNIRTRLEAYSKHAQDMNRLNKEFEAFKGNRFFNFSCLYRDYRTRERLLRCYYAYINQPISEQVAREKMDTFEAKLKQHLNNAEYLEYEE